MNLADSQLKQLDNPSLTHNERILLRCRLASEFIHTGQYESAREALGELWLGVKERPDTEKLKPHVAAELLLQYGVLSGWLGNAQHISGAQERAKDLLFESLRMFKAQSQYAKVSETKYELGMCYFRLGAFDEARVILKDALNNLKDVHLQAKILIRRSIIEVWTGHYLEAWDILDKAREFFETSGDVLKGRWHGQMGLVLRRLATAEQRADYMDRAIIEYTAAIYHYEKAKHERYCGNNLNNLAFLLYKMGRYQEAHESLDKAQKIFNRYEDAGSLAQVNETRARVFVAEKRYKEADWVISSVIRIFEQGGDWALLVDALTIQGVVWSKLGAQQSSLNILNRAISVAQESGSFFNGGLAALTLIEEHSDFLNENKLYNIYRRADELLNDAQDNEHIARLRVCARIVTKKLLGSKLSDKGFSLNNAVEVYEARFIAEALELEKGSVTRAAKRLGISHQLLSHILTTRHKDLLKLRTPAKIRRRRIAYHRPKKSKPITILHVEDNNAVAITIRDTFKREGWNVITYSDGAIALKMIESEEHYDLLLVDNELPNVSGLELIKRARQLLHRKDRPIVMLSASNIGADAWRTGVSAFLKKPEDIKKLVETVNHLLGK
jgi:CheY-like chemotaxis protein/Tfp pilus assembly protein PilF